MDAALQWAARGFRVFPLAPGEKVPPKNFSFTTEATTDPDKIRAWWGYNPHYNYAVACGNGLIVVDVDEHKGGYGSLFDLELPPTLTVRTPGGGLHLYFTGPDVPNSVERIGRGLDVRGVNGYVVGPGSFFADKAGDRGYTGTYVLVDDVPPVAAPVNLLNLAGQMRARDTRDALSIDAPEDVAYAIHYLLKDAPIAIEGQGGDNTTYKVAARLIEIGVSADTAAELLLDYWNERCLPPWTADELKKKAENAEQYAQNRQGSGGVSAAAAAFSDVEAPPAELQAPSSAGKFDAIFARRKLVPEAMIPRRDWIAYKMLMRDEATVVAGPGGVGKSAFSIALAVHGAIGRSLGSFEIHKPFKTVIYNLEDNLHEMTARLYAACASYRIDPAQVEDKILLWPGREKRFRLMDRKATVNVADIREFVRLAKGEFDVGIFDPMNSLHAEDENDNMAMGEVMATANLLAQTAHMGIMLLHHVPKGEAGYRAGSMDMFRGAAAITTGVRIAHTLLPASEADAALYGLGEGYAFEYARLDDAKFSYGPRDGKPVWLRRHGYPLSNGDATYSLVPAEVTATQNGEATLVATRLAEYMDRHGLASFTLQDAAKALTEADHYYREMVTPRGDMTAVRAHIKLRLAQRVEIPERNCAVMVRSLPHGGRVVDMVVLEGLAPAAAAA